MIGKLLAIVLCCSIGTLAQNRTVPTADQVPWSNTVVSGAVDGSGNPNFFTFSGSSLTLTVAGATTNVVLYIGGYIQIVNSNLNFSPGFTPTANSTLYILAIQDIAHANMTATSFVMMNTAPVFALTQPTCPSPSPALSTTNPAYWYNQSNGQSYWCTSNGAASYTLKPAIVLGSAVINSGGTGVTSVSYYPFRFAPNLFGNISCATGQPCGTGGAGSGTVSSGTVGHVGIYTASTTVGSDAALDDAISAANTLTYSGAGGINASGGPIAAGGNCGNSTGCVAVNTGSGASTTVTSGSTTIGVDANGNPSYSVNGGAYGALPIPSGGTGSTAGFFNASGIDHEVHVDGTTYTSMANAVTGTPLANACSTTNGCTVYEEISTDVWNTNPFFGAKNYSVYLNFGSQAGTDAGIYYTKMPVILSSDQIYGRGYPRYIGSGPNEDGSYGTVIRACVGNALCGGSYFPTAPPSPPVPAASFAGGNTPITDTINIELVWIVNTNTSPDAGLTGSTYGVPGASMPGPAITQVLTGATSGITIAAPCANPTCVFNGSGGNPADFPAFALGQAYAMNQYVTGSGTSGLNNPGTGHIYRVMQPIASSAAVTFHGTANEQVHDGSGACTSPTVSAANNCFYVESGPDANWLPVVGYLVYISLNNNITGTNGQFIRQPAGPNYCASTVNVGGTQACAVNTQYLLNTIPGNPITLTSLNQPPVVDTTHPLTVLGEQFSNGNQSVVFRSRFENLVLDGADQAGECGEDYISQEGSGYFNDICKGAVTDAFYVYTGPGSQNSTLVGGYASNNAGGTHVNSLRYGIVCDSRGGNCMRKLSDLSILAYQMAGAYPPSCVYVYGGSTGDVEIDAIHVESCVDGVTVSGFNNGAQAGNAAGPVVTLQGISGLATVTNVVHVGIGARSVAATGLTSGGGADSVLDDNSYDILGTIGQNGTYFGGSHLASANQSGMLNFFLNGINDAPMAYRYTKGTTTTAGLLACMSASRTVSACTSGSATNFIGVFAIQNGSTNTLVQTAGEALVSIVNTAGKPAGGTAAVGDNICEDTDTTGKASSYGTTACPLGTRVGVVTSITVGPAFGGAGTVSAAKPLVMLGRN